METKTNIPNFIIRNANAEDVPIILNLIKELAVYERLLDEVTATEESLHKTLFGTPKFAEVLIGELDNQAIAFAIFFHNYSTFLGKPGLYLEDLYVKPEVRSNGIGKAMISYLAKIALERDCGRFEWSVLDWNEPAISFYRKIGAVPMSEWTVQRMTGDELVKLANDFD